VPPEEYAMLNENAEAGKIRLGETENVGSQNIFIS
jgi:hypothetical protein